MQSSAKAACRLQILCLSLDVMLQSENGTTSRVLLRRYQHVFILDKLAYNVLHPYTSWMPILCWIVVRRCATCLRACFSVPSRCSGDVLPKQSIVLACYTLAYPGFGDIFGHISTPGLRTALSTTAVHVQTVMCCIFASRRQAL